MKRSKNRVILSVVLLLALVLTQFSAVHKTGQAVDGDLTKDILLAYENYEGEIGLIKQAEPNPGYGLVDKYTYETGADQRFFYQNSSSLKYKNLLTSPAYLYNIGSSRTERVGRQFDTSSRGTFGTNGFLNSSLIGKPGQTIWISGLIRAENLASTNAIEFHTGSGFWDNNDGKFEFGIFGGASTVDGQVRWGLRVTDGAGSSKGVIHNSKVQAVGNQTVLYVIKVDFASQTGGESRLTLYVNPDITKELPEVWADNVLQVTTDKNLSFKSYTVRASSGCSVDELRLGDSYYAVTPLDSIVALPVTKVKLYPVDGDVTPLLGGTVEGSNDSPMNGFELLAAVPESASGNFVELDFPDNNKTYRYVKFFAPDGTYGEIAEIEFFSGDRKLYGIPFSTVAEDGHGAEQVFDQDLSSYFKGQLANGNYIGLDLGGDTKVAKPYFEPEAGSYPEPIQVSIHTDTEDAEIYYTTNSSYPSKKNGTLYTGPFTLSKGAHIVRAIAVKDGFIDSEVFSAGYGIGVPAPEIQGLKSFHLGNSLTDTLFLSDNSSLKAVADSAGFYHQSYKHTVAGAPTEYLFQNPNKGFGHPWGNPYEKSIPGGWEADKPLDGDNTAFKVLAPIDILTTQPHSGHARPIDNEFEYAKRFYDMAKEHSPNLRYIVYGQWPRKDYSYDPVTKKGVDTDSYSLASGANSWIGQPATTWEEALDNHYIFHEELARRMTEYTQAEVNVIPSGIAMRNVLRAINRGEFPSLTDKNDLFQDQSHLDPAGAYIVSLTAFSVIYKIAPIGLISVWPSSITEEEAIKIQEIVWDTVVEYPYSGLSGDEIVVPTPRPTPEATPEPTPIGEPVEPTPTVAPTVAPTTEPTVAPTAEPTPVPEEKLARPKAVKVFTNTKKVKGNYSVNGATITITSGKKLVGSAKVKKGKFNVKISKVNPGQKLVIKASMAGFKDSNGRNVTVKMQKPTIKVNKKKSIVRGKAFTKGNVKVFLGKKIIGKGKVKANGNYKIKVKSKLRKGKTVKVQVFFKKHKASSKLKVK